MRVIVLFVVALGAASASAQAPPPAPPTVDDAAKIEARKHYDLGTRFFNLGEYAKAREEFRAAYLAKPDPVFLYNLGQCARLLDEPEEALQKYRAFLREKPDAPNRNDVDGFIKTLETEVAVRKKSTTTSTATLAPKAESIAPPPVTPTVTAEPFVAPPPPITPAPTAPPPPAVAIAPVPVVVPPPPVVVPPPAEVAATVTPPPPAVTEAPPAEAPAPSRPIYKRWYFWTAIAAVVVAGAAVGIAYAIPSDASAPSSALGDARVQ